MRRTFSTFTIASCCRSLVPRWTMKSVRTSCAIALGLSWAGVGMADEIAGPANVNAAIDPIVALKQLGSGPTPPYTWNVRGNEIDFSIIDITGTTTPVRIASGTPSSTLRLKRDGGLIGNVGINGDPDDGAHLQVNAPFTPVFRMAQSEAPFHDWDIIADHLDWRVRESGFGGNAPLVMEAGSPTSSIRVKSNGSVGMGTALPQTVIGTSVIGRVLNLRSDTDNSRFVAQGQSGGLLELVDMSAPANQKIFRQFSRSGFARFQVVRDDQSGIAVHNVIAINMSNGNYGLRVASPLHPLHLGSGAHCTAGGVWTNASSRDLKQDIEPLSSEQARDTVRALQPVGYRYKNELDERYVGFIAEDVPDLVATRDRKSLASMDVTAVLTKVVQDQELAIERLEKVNAEQRALTDKLMQRLEALERKAAAE